ncbi:MAG: amidase [Chloroflexi bacterium]|nr:amidase [Chloroflexota bacterium]
MEHTKKSGLEERLDELEALYNKKEPSVHAFLPEAARFKRLRQEASVLQRRHPYQEQRPPLYGLLLGIKDIFHADGFPTRAGSNLPSHELKGKEASCVTQLKKAGMLIAGKTVTTEFAYFAPGPTRNPNNTRHTPGGSSSGSAAAIAAGLVDLALGTQTIGSVIRPASYCGVVGFKPSYGRISTDGVIPLAPSLDHVGLFSRVVEGIAHAIPVLFSEWRSPSPTKAKPFLAIPSGDYLAHANREMLDHFENSVERLKAAGYWIKKLNPFKDFASVVERHNLILAAEAAQVHAAWFETYRHLYHHKIAALIEKGQKLSEALLTQARFEARQFRLDLSTVMDIHGIDVWLSPAATRAAPHGLASTGDPVMNLPWTQAGFPTLGLSSGTNQAGLPLGLQFTAGFNRDEDLLTWGMDFETVLRGTT